ncbi:Cytochrome P450 [Canna indica]|uniref:Cytochrome P450 n=1 Tax=Canna indica TaxID=4628 RepID=A0AAQ3KA87_9LILI|nr:Cytochrome P450 [Canna indica]
MSFKKFLWALGHDKNLAIIHGTYNYQKSTARSRAREVGNMERFGNSSYRPSLYEQFENRSYKLDLWERFCWQCGRQKYCSATSPNLGHPTSTTFATGTPTSSATPPTSTIHIHALSSIATANPNNIEHILYTRFNNYPKGKPSLPSSATSSASTSSTSMAKPGSSNARWSSPSSAAWLSSSSPLALLPMSSAIAYSPSSISLPSTAEYVLDL